MGSTFFSVRVFSLFVCFLFISPNCNCDGQKLFKHDQNNKNCYSFFCGK